MKALYIAASLLFVFILIQKKQHFLIWIPLANLFFDMGFAFYEYRSLPTFMRLFTIGLLFLYSVKYTKVNNVLSKYLIFFTLFLFVKVLLSSELISYKTFFQNAMVFFIFIISFNYFDTNTKFSKLLYSFYYLNIMGCFASIIGYLFDIGRKFEYRAVGFELDEVNIGLLNSASLFSISISIVLMPYILEVIKGNLKKIILISCSVLNYIFILLTMRRTVILVPIIGYSVFFFYSQVKLKKKIVSYILMAIIFLIITSPIYIDLLKVRFEVRERSGVFEEDRLRKEGRTTEIIDLIDEYLTVASLPTSFLGLDHNIFASSYQGGKIVHRGMHSDIGKILYGSGFIGLGFYLGLLFILYLNIRRIRSRKFKPIAYSLFFILLVLTYYGSFTLFSLRTLLFMLFAALFKMDKIAYKNNIILRQGKNHKVDEVLPIH